MKIEKNSGHYDVINWLKGFSILTIVLMHLMQFMNLPSMISKAASLGGTGVHVFFFCSGFGLYLSQYRNPLHYSAFIKKRFWKVYIPYVFIVCLIAMIPFSFVGDISERWIALLSHIFLFKCLSQVWRKVLLILYGICLPFFSFTFCLFRYAV